MFFLPFSSTPLLLSGITSGLGKTSAMKNGGSRPLLWGLCLPCRNYSCVWESRQENAKTNNKMCWDSPQTAAIGKSVGNRHKGQEDGDIPDRSLSLWLLLFLGFLRVRTPAGTGWAQHACGGSDTGSTKAEKNVLTQFLPFLPISTLLTRNVVGNLQLLNSLLSND